MAGIGSTLGRIGFGLATGGLSELPGAVDKYITHGSESAQNAGNAQMSAMDAAMQRLKAGQAEQYARRMKDLETTMAFYAPAQNYLNSIYGGDPNQTGPRPLKGPPGPPGMAPPGMGGAPPPPPGFPRPQGPPTPMSFGQDPTMGFGQRPPPRPLMPPMRDPNSGPGHF